MRWRGRRPFPIPGINRAVIQAVNVARSISDDVRAVFITDEPEDAVRMDLAEAFSAAGFQPDLSVDLAAARRALSAARFALVVLDVLLPDGDGLELLAELKCSPVHGATPVVLLSTEVEVQHRIKGLQTGADEYVGKPYDAEQVVDALANCEDASARGRGELVQLVHPDPAATAHSTYRNS